MKKIMIISGVVLFMVFSASVYYLYWSYNPYMKISAGGGGDDKYYIRHISVMYAGHGNIPIAKSIEEDLEELGEWNNEVVTELLSDKYISPFDVRVYGEIKGGQTFFRYEGIVTTKDGVTKEYREEKVFDFVLDPDMKIPKST